MVSIDGATPNLRPVTTKGDKPAISGDLKIIVAILSATAVRWWAFLWKLKEQ